MALTAGTRLGAYEVTAAIGAGGMGEVYRATDTNLKREVAIKVLPEALAADPERLARFQREAEVLAALNHPNIAHVHGLERSGRTTALVMELVEGPTLADLMADRAHSAPAAAGTGESASRGSAASGRRTPRALTTSDVLAVARQIAEALEAAHERGIIHRDLKPANIKLREDGTVKVLDFGLAKATEPTAASGDLANSPTLTSPAMTQLGVILGTAAYMAPEQARGAAVDRRADIWAFGVVLYEMLTGSPLFDGPSVTDTLAGVLKGEIDLGALPSDTPAAVRTLLRRCLERDRKRRLQAIGEARIVLDDVLDGSAAGTLAPPETHAASRPWRWIAAAATLGVLLVASLTIAVAHLREAPARALSVEFDIALPEGIGNWNYLSGPVVSPDGRYVALAGEGGLFVRPIGSTQFVGLDQSGRAALPFFSPDSGSVAYVIGSPRHLARAPVTGGAPEGIADLPFSISGAAWGPDGTIVVGQQRGPLYRLPSAGGGAPTALTTLDQSRRERGHLVSGFLPDGRLLYEAQSAAAQSCATDPCPDVSTAQVLSIDASRSTRLGEGVSSATYAQTSAGSGALLFVKGRELWAQRFDARSTVLSGEPVRLAGGIGDGTVSASMNGVLVYGAAASSPVFELAWLDRAGARLGTVGDVAAYSNPALSPDEHWLAVAVTDPVKHTRDIWVTDLVRKTKTRLTSSERDEMNPVWSPDGQTVIYSSAEADPSVRNIYRKPASGVGDAEVVLKTDAGQKNVEDWSPDGRNLIYNVDSADVWWLPLTGEGTPTALLKTSFTEDQAKLSPDGRWLAYRSYESGRAEVYVQTFPPGPRRWQISNAGGSDPQWRHDGRELFYLAEDQMMAVSIAPHADAIEAGLPQALFRVSVEQANRRNHYLVADNGKRFLIVQPVKAITSPLVTAVVNWTLPASK